MVTAAEVNFERDKLLSDLSTFGIGGPAQYFVEVSTAQQLQQVMRQARGLDLAVAVVGRGSNCLFDDRGFDGLVVCNKIDGIEEQGAGKFFAGAGASFSLLGVRTARVGWAGLEFASGIPASVGGAVFMNAGANGAETADVLTTVDYVKEDGELVSFSRDQLTFAYRSSPFQSMQGVIAGAGFQLERSESARQRQLEIIAYRKATQPYGERSAGCVFRNPEGRHAGLLIEEAGMKGMSVGDARVSDVHANFIVNAGKATAAQVLELIDLVQDGVKSCSGIVLESEVRVIPFRKEGPKNLRGGDARGGS